MVRGRYAFDTAGTVSGHRNSWVEEGERERGREGGREGEEERERRGGKSRERVTIVSIPLTGGAFHTYLK